MFMAHVSLSGIVLPEISIGCAGAGPELVKNRAPSLSDSDRLWLMTSLCADAAEKGYLPSLGGVVSTDIQTPENPVSRVDSATCSVLVYVDPDSRESVSVEGKILDYKPIDIFQVHLPPAAPTQVNVGTS